MSSCATTDQNISTKTTSSESDGESEPEWVNGPKAFEKDGHYFGVGCASINNDLTAAKSRSEGRARTNLARLKAGKDTFRITLTNAYVIKREIVEERDELCALIAMEK